MTKYRAGLPERPERIRQLPLSKTGYPIPWFVAHLDDGSRDFRVIGTEQMAEAVKFCKCWICGQALGGYQAFTVGPMCSVNRISAEPPAHRSCAQYAAVACPFLTHPEMVRRETGLAELGTTKPPGMLEHNPGVTLIWVCRDYGIKMHSGRALFQMGDPVALDFYCRGEKATYDQVIGAFEHGLPALVETTEQDEDPKTSRAFLTLELMAALGRIDGCFPGARSDAAALMEDAIGRTSIEA